MRKDILTLLDLTRDDFDGLINLALGLKEEAPQAFPLRGKSIGLLFNKPSTRTRVAFETAMIQLGGAPLFISSKDTQIARNEPIRDTARVLSRYLDALVIRTFSQEMLQEYAEFATIPVINALTDTFHPSQVLADVMTIREQKGRVQNLRIAWVGDGNNVANSWINAACIMDLELVLACPAGFTPDPQILAAAERSGRGRISVTQDPREAVAGADVIYTDVWSSMGQEAETRSRKKAFADFRVDEELVSLAAGDAIVMHCLPAHRGEEISEAVLEGDRSVIWDQSENKLHMNKAILLKLITGRS